MKPKHYGALLVAFGALSACQAILGVSTDPRVADSGVDDVSPSPPDAGPDVRLCNPEVTPFKTPRRLDELDVVSSSEYSATLTADELSIFYIRNVQPWGEAIWTANRDSIAEPFRNPHLVYELDDDDAVSGLSISPDGLTLFFSRLVPLQSPNAMRDIWVAKRDSIDLTFQKPELVKGASSVDWEFELSLGPQSNDLYMTLQKTQPLNVEMNVMLARFVDGGWEAPRKFLSVSDPTASEHAPVLSTDENKMYFTRRFDADGAEGGFVFPARSSDVYFTYRTSKVEPFAAPVRIDELARSDRGEQAMWLSPDQCRLYLQIVGPAAGGWDLYVAERAP